MEVVAQYYSEFGHALRLSYTAANTGWQALECSGSSESTVDHRSKANAATLQHCKTSALHTGCIFERSPCQQCGSCGRRLLRSAAGERQSGASGWYCMGDQPKDGPSSGLWSLLGCATSKESIRSE